MIMNFLVDREHIFDGFNNITIYKFEHQHWQFEYINLKKLIKFGVTEIMEQIQTYMARKWLIL